MHICMYVGRHVNMYMHIHNIHVYIVVYVCICYRMNGLGYHEAFGDELGSLFIILYL